MTGPTKWAVHAFRELDPGLLYAVLKLRTDVFVVEQDCQYPELDDKDQDALHVVCTDGHGTPVAYARILPPTDARGPAVGRVVRLAESRWFLGE